MNVRATTRDFSRYGVAIVKIPSAAALALFILGCGSATAPPAPPVADAGWQDAVEPPSPQRPPRGGQAAMEEWLAAGWFRSWRCEPDISPPRLTGNHGRHRICSNDLLLASAEGPYPVGAASVKELFNGQDPNGFAVGLKVEAGLGPHTWSWYERRGPSPTAKPLAQGVGVPDCAVCHGMAGRDNVFFRAP